MKKQKFWCGINGCSGHASKMGCYQHRTKLRKEKGVLESIFHPIQPITKTAKKKNRRKNDLPVPLVLTPIARKKEQPAFERFMEQLLPVLMGVPPREATVTMELGAGPFFKRLLTIKFEER